MENTKVPTREILTQLYRDLIGKDSHRGITLSYSWLANQTGHFALGFIPTVVVDRIVGDILCSAIYVSLFWLIFETFNVVWPLRKDLKNKKVKFSPRWKNIVFDTFTDLMFFWLGSFCVAKLYSTNTTIGYILLASTVILFFCSKHWFVVKLYQQRSNFPKQFRLSQWDKTITEINYNTVIDFLKTKTKGNHMLIYGGEGKGKSSLAIGIANEKAIEMNRSYYITMQKMIPFLIKHKNPEDKNIFDWKINDYLVVDDIHADVESDLMNLKADQFCSFIEANTVCYDENIKSINKMNIIWVVGKHCTKSRTDQCEDVWQETLIRFGVPLDKIYTVDLDNLRQ